MTTLAGLGPDPSWGFTDGPGAAGANTARFRLPEGVATDGAGVVYTADTGNNAIRKIDAAGNVTTLAGLGPSGPGWVDGPGTAGANVAAFNGPAAVAVDASGNLYVADTNNNAIREIDSSGNVTTLAGLSGGPGWVDGPGASGTNVARFAAPTGISIDGAGNLYIADLGNCAVRELDASGNVRTLAGLGPSSCGWVDGAGGPNGVAEFQSPTALALDGAGNIYVTDYGHVREISPSLNVTTVGCVQGASVWGIVFLGGSLDLDVPESEMLYQFTP